MNARRNGWRGLLALPFGVVPALALLCGVVLALPAFAQEQQEPEGDADDTHSWSRPALPDPELRNRPRLSEKNQRRYTKATEYLFEERYEDAKRELDKSYFRRMNEVEKAKFHQLYAQIAAAQEDRDEARRRFQLALETDGGLLAFEREDTRFKIAQLHMQDQNWKPAAETLETWFREVETPNASAYYILAICYYQLQDLERAKPAAQQAVARGNPPQEGWLQLLLAIQLFDKEYAEAVPVIEQLISFYPKKDYFLSLSTVHGALGSFEKAAVPLQLAYDAGLLRAEEEFERLGQLLMFLNLPYRAGVLLANALEEQRIEPDSEVLAMLSNSWIAAREYADAIDPLEQAAHLAETGELYLRLAQVHVQREAWQAAADAIEEALAKGGLQQPGDAHLLMGIVLFSAGQPAASQRWFENASGYETTRDEARIWLQHIAQELAVQEAAQTGG